MALADFLQALLRQPGGPQNALAQAASAQGTAGPVGTAQYGSVLQAMFQPQSAPQAAPQAAPQGVSPVMTGSVPSAPPSAPAPSPAAPAGNGLSGLFQGLENILNPQARGRNATINYLTKQGYDPGTAMLIAGDKPLLRQVLVGNATQNSPKSQLELEKLGLEVNNLRNPTTSDITEYNFDKKNGYTGSFHDWMIEKNKSSSVNVNLPGQPNIGSIPAGYQAVQDPTTKMWTMQPIPGGPADTAQTDAAKAGSQATKSDVITNAYKTASDLVGGSTTGLIGQGLGVIPPTSAAELRRQVDVLKANATVESLNAMRAQSKTGGALGNVTEKEGAMLAATAGALNPNASPEQFKAALDNYYHTLLRIVNGPEAGDKMFNDMKGNVPGNVDLTGDKPPPGWEGDPKLWPFMDQKGRAAWMKRN